VTAVLADEAVFIATRVVIPRVAPFLIQIEACFPVVQIVRFISVFSPVCAAHSPVACENDVVAHLRELSLVLVTYRFHGQFCVVLYDLCLSVCLLCLFLLLTYMGHVCLN